MMDNRLKEFVENIGYARIIIGLFLIVLLVSAFLLKLPMSNLFEGILVRTGMNGILVLAMVPSIQSGTGLNFGLPIGIICGLIGTIISIEMNLVNWNAFIVSLIIGSLLGAISGYLYGILLNKVKGQEMLVGTYAAFSIVSGMCMFWLLAPFYSPKMIWPYGGKGLRVTISLENVFDKILNNWVPFGMSLDKFPFRILGVNIPIGLLLFFGIFCFIFWIFSRSKTGITMHAAGSNPKFAESSGINVDKARIIGTVLSTMLGAIGIIVYAQSYGFLQLYTAPQFMAFPAVASILIGGASIKTASIMHVIIGTFLFQSLLVVALPVANVVLEGSLSEVVRIIISNGIILYALTRIGGGEEH